MGAKKKENVYSDSKLLIFLVFFLISGSNEWAIEKEKKKQ